MHMNAILIAAACRRHCVAICKRQLTRLHSDELCSMCAQWLTSGGIARDAMKNVRMTPCLLPLCLCLSLVFVSPLVRNEKLKQNNSRTQSHRHEIGHEYIVYFGFECISIKWNRKLHVHSIRSFEITELSILLLYFNINYECIISIVCICNSTRDDRCGMNAWHMVQWWYDVYNAMYDNIESNDKIFRLKIILAVGSIFMYAPLHIIAFYWCIIILSRTLSLFCREYIESAAMRNGSACWQTLTHTHTQAKLIWYVVWWHDCMTYILLTTNNLAYIYCECNRCKCTDPI